MKASIHDRDDVTVHVTSVPHDDREPTEFVDFRQDGDEIAFFASLDRQEELARAWLSQIAVAREGSAKAGDDG